jgi:hypothetical protein
MTVEQFFNAPFYFIPAMLAVVYIPHLLAGIGLYFLPMIIAFYRGHPHPWILSLLNFLLGFTGIVWLLCLIWSLAERRQPQPLPYETGRREPTIRD